MRDGPSGLPESAAGGDGLLLVGGGGHCRALIDVLEAAGLPAAGVVHGPDCELRPMLGVPALGRDADLPVLRRRFSSALVGVGQIRSPGLRMRLFSVLEDLGFRLPAVISPLGRLSPHAVLGRGSVIMHGARVNAGAEVGANVIVNTNALVEHDCVVGDHCHVAVGAILCGGAAMECGAFVGAGAVCREGVRIGARAVVGCGAVVLRDVPEGATVTGTWRGR